MHGFRCVTVTFLPGCIFLWNWVISEVSANKPDRKPRVEESGESTASFLFLSTYQWIVLVFTLLIVGGTYILFYWDDDSPLSTVADSSSSSSTDKKHNSSTVTTTISSSAVVPLDSSSSSSTSSRNPITTASGSTGTDSNHGSNPSVSNNPTISETINNSNSPKRNNQSSKPETFPHTRSPPQSPVHGAAAVRIIPSSPTLSSSTDSGHPKTLTVPSILREKRCQEIFQWDEFSLNDILGTGQTCNVYRCQVRPEYTNLISQLPNIPKRLCVKVYHMDHVSSNIREEEIEKFTADAKREYDTLSKFNHPQILRVLISYNEYVRRKKKADRIEQELELNAGTTKGTERIPSKFFVVMEQAQVMPAGELATKMSTTDMKNLREYCGPSDLHYYMSTRNRMSEGQVALIMYQILLGVRELHRVNLVHRDLKPANILLFDQTTIRNYGVIPICKLGDFGLVREGIDESGNMLKTPNRGTPLYMPPEAITIVDNENFKAAYGTEFDIFSLGGILFNLITNQFPYEMNQFLIRKAEMIKKGEINWKLTTQLNLSASSVALMKKMLNTDGTKRPSIHQVLADPWFDTYRDTAVALFGV